MFAEIGKPNANVRVCLDPLMGGISEATKWERIKKVLDLYPMVNVFLLIVDRDGKETRRQSLDGLETSAAVHLSTARKFLAEHAWQEIEVWAIAGQPLPKAWNWADIRQHRDPKEAYFEPLANSRNLQNEPGQGRTTLGKEAAANYARVRTLCQEDIQQLEDRLKVALSGMSLFAHVPKMQLRHQLPRQPQIRVTVHWASRFPRGGAMVLDRKSSGVRFRPGVTIH